MSTSQDLYETLSLEVENVAGISETSVELSEGVTVLEGHNATNRTSLLQALMAAMGSDQFTLKGDADNGRVELSLGDTVVERRFERQNGGVRTSGEGYLDDPKIADLFAFLLEENEARRAVARGDDLREILVRPIDTNEIKAEIERLQANKRNVEERISHIEDRERDLVDLEQRKQRLESKVEEKRERLEELEAEIEEADTDLTAEREAKTEIEEQLDALKDRRSQLDDIRFQLETLQETIDSLESERDEKRERLDEVGVAPDEDVSSLRAELEDLRDRQRRVNTQMSELQSIVQFNEEMLEGTNGEISSVLRDETDDAEADPTDRLLEDETSVTCWTCGSEVEREEIEETLDRLRSFRREKLSERQSLQEEIDETKERLSSLEDAQAELRNLEDRVAEIDVQIEEKEGRIEELEDEREALHEEIEELEAAVEDQQTADYGDVLELHKDANRVELELEQTESELASVEDEIAEIESLVDDREEYEERHDQITAELAELRNRIERLETDAVEAFNEHMAEVLDILEYENIARIWIDRKEREAREGRRNVTKSHFELHVVREAESGEAYEGTVDTLSESEREVVGLVFALAGYRVHELHEDVPVMLLDSLEAIDSNRIARLVDYFADYPGFLVVALLPEDANAVDDEYDIVTTI